MVTHQRLSRGRLPRPPAPDAADADTSRESLLEFAAHLGQIGGWRVDLPGKLTWTKEVCEIFGLPPDTEFDLEQAMSSCPREWRAEAETAFWTCALEGVAYDHEIKITTPGGEQVWVRSIGRPVRGETGAIVAVQGALQNIDDKKHAEDAVLQSERRFRSLADSMPWIVWTSDPDGTVDYFNTATYAFAGSLDTTDLGASWLSFIHPEDGPIAWATWEKGMVEETQYEVEIRIRRHDGEYRWHLNRAVPVRNDAGGLVKWYGTATDIHDRRVSEEETRRMAARLTATLESITDAFFVLDAEWRFQYLNGESERILKRTRQELLGGVVWDLYPDTAGTIFETEYRRALAQRCTVEFDCYYEPLERWLQVRAYPSDDGLAVYFRDITADKEAAAERATLEAQLRQSQKMEAVGRLAGGVAHDFNNLLSIILGHTEILMERLTPDSDLYADLEVICAAGGRSANLTRQLLAFARKQTITPRTLDVNDTLGGMLAMLERLLGEDIELVFRPGSHLSAVRMDPAQLDQVIVNLAINARDAISTVGKILVETGDVRFDAAHCATHPGLQPGAYVRIAVSDDGCGMDGTVLRQVFEPFFTTKPLGQGTGLGLATVYGILKQNEGYVEVTSAPGKGSCFEVYLPAHAPTVMPVEVARQERPLTGGETILLVEDELALLQLCRRRLEKLGYQVIFTHDPLEAVRIADDFPGEIHLLLTDVVMPQLSGRDLWTKVKKSRPGLRCLFMSGYTADIISDRGVLAEGVRFLAKPFTQDALGARIRDALEQLDVQAP